MATRAVEELRQIPFGVLIGQPMKAAVEAQALAAKTTVEFIEKVGFIPDDEEQDLLFIDEAKDADAGEVRNVTFSYTKKDEDGADTDVSLSVPILTIVPIPYLRIDEMTIDFTAKLTDMIQHTTKTGFKLDSSLKTKYKSWWSPVSVEFRSSMSYSRQSASASRYNREYTMEINVRAVQDDIPAGMGRVLDILESIIEEKESEAPPA